MGRLSEIVVRTPLKLMGLNFAEMFVWLSASMQKISQSKPDDMVALPPPGWGRYDARRRRDRAYQPPKPVPLVLPHWCVVAASVRGTSHKKQGNRVRMRTAGPSSQMMSGRGGCRWGRLSSASHRPLMSCIPPSKTCLSTVLQTGTQDPQTRPDALTWRDALDEGRATPS